MIGAYTFWKAAHQEQECATSPHIHHLKISSLRRVELGIILEGIHFSVLLKSAPVLRTF
jgi:hypothetical protein